MSEDKRYIQQAIYNVLIQDAFIGNLLQELSVRVDNRIPTAGLTFDKKAAKFNILINEDFFSKLNVKERVAVFFHELLHFTHGHLFRFEAMGNPKDQMLKNIAADMAINQYINNLPDKCIRVSDYKMKDGSAFPLFQRIEVYFELLKQTTKPKCEGQENKPGKGESINTDQVGQYQPFDEHDWDDLSEEEKERMLTEAKNILKRTIEKTYSEAGNAPSNLKELLENLEASIRKLNYKHLLKYAIKKTLASNDRAHSWNRLNKRYGAAAPGTTLAQEPFINFYFDMSGSISHMEANSFLQVIDGFLQAGSKKCNLGFWHTELYRVRKYKKNEKLTEDDMGSGGTNVSCVLDHIKEKHPNLSIILTDGHFYDNVSYELTDKIIWIISKGGLKEHTYKHIGKTISLEDIVNE